MKSMVFLILMLFMSFIKTSFAKETPQEIQNFDCGTHCKATLYDDGLLKIIPTDETGVIKNYDYPQVSSTEGRLTTAPWSEYKDNIKSIEISDGITVIGRGAFTGLKNVTDVKIADSVVSIGGLAFADESNLKNVKMSNNLKTLDDYAFGNARKLEHLDLPNTLTKIGDYAFWATKIHDIIIPDSVTSIGEGAFTSSQWYNRKIYCQDILVRKCDEIVNETTDGADKLVKYSIKGDRYILNGEKYRTLNDMLNNNPVKRIYTVEEATKLSKPTNNTFKIRYK